MKRYFVLFALILSVHSLKAQNSNLQSAINYLTYYTRDNDKSALEKARAAIDDASINEKTLANPKVWLVRAKVYYQILLDKDYTAKYPNATDETYNSLVKAITLDTKGSDKDESLQYMQMATNALYNAGTDAYNAKSYTDAYNEFKKANDANDLLIQNGERSKLDTFIVYGLASSARKADMKDEAKRLFQLYVDKKFDKDPNAYYMLSSIYLDDKDTTNSIKALDQGLTRYPGDNSLVTEELRIYLDGNKFAELEQKAQDAITKDPNNPIYQFVMGLVYEQKSTQSQTQGKKDEVNTDRDNARKAYEAAIALNPDYFEAIYNLGNLKVEEANDIIEQIDATAYTDTKKIDDLTKQKDALFKESLGYFEKAIALNPKSVETVKALKEIYTRLGDYDKANEMKAKLKELGVGS